MTEVVVDGFVFPYYKKLAKFVAQKVVEFMGQPKNLEIAISFVSENEIRNLNKTMRNIDKVTDVLSFPSTDIRAGEILDITNPNLVVLVGENGLVHFGDMAICFKQAKRQAKEFGSKTKYEIKKLVIHSMLHLMGYDHIKDEDYEIMKKYEDKLDGLIKI